LAQSFFVPAVGRQEIAEVAPSEWVFRRELDDLTKGTSGLGLVVLRGGCLLVAGSCQAQVVLTHARSQMGRRIDSSPKLARPGASACLVFGVLVGEEDAQGELRVVGKFLCCSPQQGDALLRRFCSLEELLE